MTKAFILKRLNDAIGCLTHAEENLRRITEDKSAALEFDDVSLADMVRRTIGLKREQLQRSAGLLQATIYHEEHNQ